MESLEPADHKRICLPLTIGVDQLLCATPEGMTW